MICARGSRSRSRCTEVFARCRGEEMPVLARLEAQHDRSTQSAMMLAILRENQWPIGVYTTLIVLAVASVFRTVQNGPIVAIGMPLVVLFGMITVAAIVQSDSPIRADAFWAPRPLSLNMSGCVYRFTDSGRRRRGDRSGCWTHCASSHVAQRCSERKAAVNPSTMPGHIAGGTAGRHARPPYVHRRASHRARCLRR